MKVKEHQLKTYLRQMQSCEAAKGRVWLFVKIQNKKTNNGQRIIKERFKIWQRIAGIDIPREKQAWLVIALTYVYGIGNKHVTRSKLKNANVDEAFVLKI